jgi:hypothetical protein
VKTTLEIPDDLFRRSKATAALRGESLREFVTAAIRGHLEHAVPAPLAPEGWRSVFGRARPEEVAEVDAIVAADLEQVDLDDWR